MTLRLVPPPSDAVTSQTYTPGPRTSGGRIFGITVIVAVAWIVASLSRLFTASRRLRGTATAINADQFRELEAIRSLRWQRGRRLIFAGCVAGAISVALVEIAVWRHLNGTLWWVVALVALAGLAGIAKVVDWFGKPISDHELRAEIRRLASRNNG